MTTTQLAVLLGLGSGTGLLLILREAMGRVGRLPHPVYAAQLLTATAEPSIEPARRLLRDGRARPGASAGRMSPDGRAGRARATGPVGRMTPAGGAAPVDHTDHVHPPRPVGPTGLVGRISPAGGTGPVDHSSHVDPPNRVGPISLAGRMNPAGSTDPVDRTSHVDPPSPVGPTGLGGPTSPADPHGRRLDAADRVDPADAADTAEPHGHLGAAGRDRVGSPGRFTPSARTDPLADQLGRLVLRRGLAASLLQVPYRDLALLRRSVAQFAGERALYAVVGLVAPTAAAAALAIAGMRLPFAVPAVAGLVAAVALSYLPLYTVADLARTKRTEFRRAMAAYVDLVALERAAGSGPTQALESAAGIGASWAFQRVRDELARARWAGVPAWEALRTVGRDLRLPELTDIGDVLRMSAREGATVYDVLRSRASAMRTQLLTGDQARAGARTERATAPLAATAVVFMLLLAAPVAMRIG